MMSDELSCSVAAFWCRIEILSLNGCGMEVESLRIAQLETNSPKC
jgi:hypothetical protein